MSQKNEVTAFGSLFISLSSMGMAIFFFVNSVSAVEAIIGAEATLMAGEGMALISLLFTAIFASTASFFAMHYLSSTSKSGRNIDNFGASAAV